MKPFVKWAGGKRQILKKINEFINDSINDNEEYTYIEPFLGGGAILFDKKPTKAIVNDLNEDLINTYKVIKSDNFVELINLLKKHEIYYKNSPDEYFYEVRSWDRDSNFMTKYNEVERAARMIFLNKTCYNGLYRVNNKGQFNTPIGRYKNPNICDEMNIREIHDYLSSDLNDIKILCGSYENAFELAKDGDVIYVDPPYDYEDDDGFTRYQLCGFTFDDFIKLKKTCDEAINKGAFVVISNNATQKVLDLFAQDAKYKIFYDVTKLSTLRTINCKGAGRKSGREVIIRGMNSNIPFPQANSLDKIITLICKGQKIISQKDDLMKLINVSSTRQVAYYLSALQYFGYLKCDKTFTDKALKISGNINDVKRDIAKTLLANNEFKSVYKKCIQKGELSVEEITKILKVKGISQSTITRRASTIKARANWMKENNLLNEIN